MIESHNFDEDEPIPKWRESFEKKFPNLKWETTGGTQDIPSFISTLLSELIESIPDNIAVGNAFIDLDKFLKQSLKEKYL